MRDTTLMAEQRRLSLTERMQRIRKINTGPEMIVRRLVHAMGYRYRLHRSDLPGTPDLVFPSRKKVILVHGCFWHQHTCPRGDRQPSSNRAYWLPKLRRNVERDKANIRALRRNQDGRLKSLAERALETADIAPPAPTDV